MQGDFEVRSVLIAVPTTGGIMKSNTGVTVGHIVKALLRAGVDAHIHNVDSADIITARDIYANMLLHSSAWDALFFVDSDMEFNPQFVLRLLSLNVEFAAASCTKRNLDVARLVNAYREHGDLGVATAQSSVFNVMESWSGAPVRLPPPRDGFIPMAAVGMACALVRKSVLQQMVEKGVVQKRADLKGPNNVTCWSFFSQIDRDGSPLTEDYSFCFRWTNEMRKDLWVCIDEPIGHVGSFSYKALYSDLMRTRPQA
jgi:hypothetical protein